MSKNSVISCIIIKKKLLIIPHPIVTLGLDRTNKNYKGVNAIFFLYNYTIVNEERVLITV